jgi:hypothetical protein
VRSAVIVNTTTGLPFASYRNETAEEYAPVDDVLAEIRNREGR